MTIYTSEEIYKVKEKEKSMFYFCPILYYQG